MELNPEVDLSVNVANLHAELRNFPLVLYRYSCYKADVEKKRDIAKAKLKEIRAVTRKRIKGYNSVKHTENSLEAEIDTDPTVLEVQRRFIEAEHDAATWAGAVESMRAKKDMLVQLSADSRKEK